jgi:phosphodiesterase/alkaline phosphatase D-like protein
MLIPRRLSTVGSDPSGDAEPLAAVLQSDAWDGYPSSFNALFEILAATRARNVIFLSGDEHRCCRASATQLGPGGVTIHSIHSSGLYTPYVFANASPEDFVPEETLALGASQWRVQSEFAPPGQGFALIRVTPQTESWTVEIRFSLHSGRSTDVSNRDHTLHLPRRFDQP